jgi:hypothetical protein
MTVWEITAGLAILQSYYEERADTPVEVTAYGLSLRPTDRPVSEEDTEQLEDLGWAKSGVSGNWICHS